MNIKIFYSVLIFTGQFTFSLLAGIIAPSLIDIRLLLQSATAPSSFSSSAEDNGDQKGVVSLRSVALMFTFYFVGSILGSFISIAYKSTSLRPYINRQLVTSVLMLIFALAVGAIPHGCSIWTLYALITVGGIGCSNWNVVATTQLIEIWNDQPKVVAAMLQVQQFAFGLGTVAAPLVVKPFLSGTTSKDAEVLLSGEELTERRNSLAIPFAACAGIEGAVGLIFLFAYLLKATRYQKVEEKLEEHSEAGKGQTTSKSVTTTTNVTPKLFDTPAERQSSESRGGRSTTVFKVAFIVIFTFFSVCELGHISFQNTYFQLLPRLNVSGQEAAEIASLTAVTYTLGRAVSVPVSGLLLSSGAILNAHFLLCLASFAGFFWSSAAQSRLWLAVNSALAGYALSPIRSSLFAYVNTYTTADDRLNALLFVSICIGSVFSPLLIGPYIEAAPSVLIYLDLASIGLALATFIAVQVLVRRATAVSRVVQQQQPRPFVINADVVQLQTE